MLNKSVRWLDTNPGLQVLGVTTLADKFATTDAKTFSLFYSNLVFKIFWVSSFWNLFEQMKKTIPFLESRKFLQKDYILANEWTAYLGC